MKIKHLILLLLLAAPLVSRTQNSSEVDEVYPGHPVTGMSLVRNHLFDHTVSYSNGSAGRYLVYTDHTNFIMGTGGMYYSHYISLPDAIRSVYDLHTTWDYVYFCGSTYRYATVPNQVLHEVFRTSAGVVFVGYDRVRGLFLRKANASNVLSSADIGDLHYYSPSLGEVNAWTVSAVCERVLAVSYMYYDNTTANFTARIRYFDLNTMLVFNSQEYSPLDKSSPLEMAYIPYTGKPVLVHPFQFPFSTGLYNANFIQLEPGVTVNHNAAVFYHPGKEYASLCPLGSNVQVACFGNRWYCHNYYPPFTGASSCIQESTIPVKPIANLTHDLVASPLTPRDAVGITRVSGYDKNEFYYIRQCFN